MADIDIKKPSSTLASSAVRCCRCHRCRHWSRHHRHWSHRRRHWSRHLRVNSLSPLAQSRHL